MDEGVICIVFEQILFGPMQAMQLHSHNSLMGKETTKMMKDTY